MSTQKPRETLLEELTRDPKLAAKLAEVLEGYRRIALRMGSAQPLIRAISASIGLMANPNTRADYDEFRRLVIGYLRSLDASELGATPSSDVEFQRSPAVTEEQVLALAVSLSAAAPAKR